MNGAHAQAASPRAPDATQIARSLHARAQTRMKSSQTAAKQPKQPSHSHEQARRRREPTRAPPATALESHAACISGW